MEEMKIKESRAKEEAIGLLREQMKIEGELVGLYEKTASEIKNKPVRHLLHMIQLDSRKHISICQTSIEILQGEDVLEEEKKELIKGLKAHMELEKNSIDRASEMLNNVWIRENKALTELIKKLRDDEKRHHKMLQKLAEKPFFRLDPDDWTLIFRDADWVEQRYARSREFQKKKMR